MPLIGIQRYGREESAADPLLSVVVTRADDGTLVTVAEATLPDWVCVQLVLQVAGQFAESAGAHNLAQGCMATAHYAETMASNPPTTEGNTS